MKRTIYTVLTVLSASAFLAGCQSRHIPKHVLDLSGRNTKVSPAQNFFEYANGNWVKNTDIPPSKTGWGSFYIVRDQALTRMNTILDSCQRVKNPAQGSIIQQLGDLYASAMDSTSIEEAGLAPLRPALKRIDSISSPEAVLAVVVAEYKHGNGTLFSFGVSPDDRNSNVERAQFNQGGLGLPNRNYYFKQDSTSRSIRDAYHRYVATILALSGDSTGAAKDADSVIALETSLAAASKTPVELRNPLANYHLLSLREIQKKAPAISWLKLTSGLHVMVDTLQVGQPEFYKALSDLLKKTPVSVWKDYLAFHLINGYAPWLSKPFAGARFAFYNKLLNGQQVPELRWKRVTGMINGSLGDALGKLYVEKYFPPSAKSYMMNLVNNLQRTYRERIRQNTWMSDSTKAKAIDKLDAYIKKIGYPDKWKDYSSIAISRSSLIEDLQHIGTWKYWYNLRKLGKPVDKTEWYMTAPTVNAYYNPSFNEIVFPAGILQPPFYFQDGDDAVNYGAIGAVIGHEMTHGFDDQGSKYDKNGNLHNWWTTQDSIKFGKLASEVVKEYDAYTVLDSIHVNGRLTEGENIADIGGLAIAYNAFKNTPEGKSDTTINGLTPDQRFFLSFAQIWRVKDRPQRLLWRINNDPHSPEMYRVNGPTSNMAAFYKTFHVKPGDKMYRPDSIRIHIW